jgi:UPF0755 protein
MDTLNENFLKTDIVQPRSTKPFIIVAIILFAILAYFFAFSAPRNFPRGSIFQVGQGDTLRTVSLHLKIEGIIRSRLLFESFVILQGGERHIMRADYLFEEPISAFEVARRIAKGDRHISKVSVTIPEGYSNAEIADTYAAKLHSFDKAAFLASAKDLQGYLFPDTYFFFSTDGAPEVLLSMRSNFDKKFSPIRALVEASGKTEKDIITMASLLEKEANGDEDRDIISGILWHRIAINMPLQADAAPETYKHRGLPAMPIGNPGLEAIQAALHPKASTYLYYLHDKNGVAHYAHTLSEHDNNIKLYLK